MAITKASTAFSWASGSATASGTTNPISTTGDYAQQVYVDLVQTGTATTAASFIVQVSPDGTTWFSLIPITAPTAAGTYDWVIDVPITAESVRIQYTQQAGGTSSSLTAQLGQVTAV
jgi:hypothetical protein